MSSIVDIIKKKRDGRPLTDEEIKTFVVGASKKLIDDSQTGAMLMAIFLNGMTDEETMTLTKEFIQSGDQMSWDGDVCDKHSTGGVGDKVSLALAPALAANGVKVPMISGRGLDFTGGTLDKLESIPGFKVDLSREQMGNSLAGPGFFISASTSRLCPADKAIYAIRDITGTVESYPLIAASIMGKKFVEGTRNLVLDLKVGSAAFVKTVEEGRRLSETMMKVADSLGMKLKVLLTRMESPLGRSVGNSIEVKEALDILKGGGPHVLKDLICRLGGELLFMTGKTVSYIEGYRLIKISLENGTALKKWEEGLIAQGVDPAVAETLCHDDPWLILPLAPKSVSFKAEKSGYVVAIEAMSIAIACRDLGGGRIKPGEPIDHAVGAYLHFDIGSEISEGQAWLTIYYNKPLDVGNFEKLKTAIKIAENYNRDEVKTIIAVLPD